MAKIRLKSDAAGVRLLTYHLDQQPSDLVRRQDIAEFAKRMGVDVVITPKESIPTGQDPLDVIRLDEAARDNKIDAILAEAHQRGRKPVVFTLEFTEGLAQSIELFNKATVRLAKWRWIVTRTRRRSRGAGSWPCSGSGRCPVDHPLVGLECGRQRSPERADHRRADRSWVHGTWPPAPARRRSGGPGPGGLRRGPRAARRRQATSSKRPTPPATPVVRIAAAPHITTIASCWPGRISMPW